MFLKAISPYVIFYYFKLFHLMLLRFHVATHYQWQWNDQKTLLFLDIYKIQIYKILSKGIPPLFLIHWNFGSN
jgi:hypothetical protein